MPNPYTVSRMAHPPAQNIGVVRKSFPDLLPWGGGIAPVSPFSLSAPTVDEWEFFSSGDEAVAQITALPARAHYYQLRTQHDTDGWMERDKISVNTPAGGGDASVPGTYYGQIRWISDDVATVLSDWSESQVFTIL